MHELMLLWLLEVISYILGEISTFNVGCLQGYVAL